jgi:DNA-binding PadR family transcriptional regulator
VQRNPQERALPLGASAFYILLALADSEHHGAYIAEEVECATNGAIRMLPGALYRHLKQMADDGWIIESETDDSDGRRKYYRLTSRGKRIAQAEARRLERVVGVARMRRLLPGLR